ncbi:unnamed protein product [Scytosiphon promiscuus]
MQNGRRHPAPSSTSQERQAAAGNIRGGGRDPPAIRPAAGYEQSGTSADFEVRHNRALVHDAGRATTPSISKVKAEGDGSLQSQPRDFEDVSTLCAGDDGDTTRTAAAAAAAAAAGDSFGGTAAVGGSSRRGNLFAAAAPPPTATAAAGAAETTVGTGVARGSEGVTASRPAKTGVECALPPAVGISPPQPPAPRAEQVSGAEVSGRTAAAISGSAAAVGLCPPPGAGAAAAAVGVRPPAAVVDSNPMAVDITDTGLSAQEGMSPRPPPGAAESTDLPGPAGRARHVLRGQSPSVAGSAWAKEGGRRLSARLKGGKRKKYNDGNSSDSSNDSSSDSSSDSGGPGSSDRSPVTKRGKSSRVRLRSYNNPAPYPSSTSAPATLVPKTEEGTGVSRVMSSRIKTCDQKGSDGRVCPRRPSFGFPGDMRATRCASHKLDGHEDIVSRRCDGEGCDRIPSFRLPGDKENRRFCAAHKLPGFEDYHKTGRSCRVAPEGAHACNRSSSFGFEGGKRISCAQHKQKGMINLNSPGCRQPGCNLTPGFGMRGTAAIYCSKHKKANMINVISKRCENESCDRIPSYNYDAVGAKAIYCNTHKTEGMINVRHPRCANPECKRQPSFGKAGQKVAVFCVEHKEPQMVDVKNNYGKRKRKK